MTIYYDNYFLCKDFRYNLVWTRYKGAQVSTGVSYNSPHPPKPIISTLTVRESTLKGNGKLNQLIKQSITFSIDRCYIHFYFLTLTTIPCIFQNYSTYQSISFRLTFLLCQHYLEMLLHWLNNEHMPARNSKGMTIILYLKESR